VELSTCDGWVKHQNKLSYPEEASGPGLVRRQNPLLKQTTGSSCSEALQVIDHLKLKDLTHHER
jgi:hypothetical protein